MTKSAAANYTFYTSAEYWPELIKRIEQTKSGERIMLTAMDFDPTYPKIKAVTHALLQATKRGVHVWLVVDAHTFLSDSNTQKPGPLWYGHNLNPQKTSALFRPRLEAIEEINALPTGHAVVINKPARRYSNPFAGRSHIKFSLFNDAVFIGGCNLYNTNQLDLMVLGSSKKLADYIFDFGQRAIGEGNVGESLVWQDQMLQLDSGTLLIDAGKRGQSIILEQALQLIDEAKETITITCQFFPNSITAQHLADAHHRGVRVHIVFAHPSKHGPIGGAGQRYSMWREKQRVPIELFARQMDRNGPKLHAKLLVTDVGTMIGSHNLVRAGVRLGTAEIALLNRNLDFNAKALAAFERMYKP